MAIAGDAGRWARRLAGSRLAWVGLAVAAVMATGVLRPVEDAFAGLRFALLRHPVSRQLSVVEIDPASLKAAGRWPWSRERFATAVANLQAAGANTVAFDVDFSVQSSAAADQALAHVVSARPGTVILPAFVQASDRSDKLVETYPLDTLAGGALVASVNLPIDLDGRARRYEFGFGRDEGYRQSMAAALAGTAGQPTGTFLLDYSVDPRTVPHLSFEDVFENRFDRSLVKGRNVLIGAHALELGDAFSTPQYGVVNGVYLHALAFEQLRAGRALFAPEPLVTFALALALAWFLRADRRRAGMGSSLRRHAFAAAGLLVVPVAVQAFSPVSLQVAPLALAQGFCVLWATRAELARRAKAIVAEREAGLLHLALHEPETELPNRRALVADIAARLAAAPGAMAVLAIGVDRYPAIRGAVGYGLASQIVRAVADRLADVCPDSTVAHLSTSILGLALTAADEATLAAGIARLQALEPNYVVAGHAVDAHVKLGLARAGEGAEAESLLEQASLALDEARRLDQDTAVFEPARVAQAGVNLALMTEMRRGLAEGHLQMHYQPKMATRDGAITGAEGLIRWRHPVHGPIRPDEFITIAEETGAIRDLTLWTLERALADADRLHAAGHDLLVSVNISGRLIVDPGFCATMAAIAKGREKRLCLEITETALISNPDVARALIDSFRAAGVKISIDDYGAGLSSLSYLKMIDANELKIDKSLVGSVAENRRDRMIMKSTIDLAHSLGMVVVAEGVETAEVEMVLAGLGCDLIQGYLIAKPMSLADLEVFLASWRREAPAA